MSSETRRGRTAYHQRRAAFGLLLIALVAMAAGLGFGSSKRHENPDDSGKAQPPTRVEMRKARLLEQKRETQAIDRVLAYTSFFQKGVGRKREVALTFDDGPGPYTPQIMRILRRTGTPATFFQVGVMVDSFGKLLKQQLRRGDALGNHTLDHARMSELSAQEQLGQLQGQSKAVARVGAPVERLFRPPFGSYDSKTLELLAESRMLMVLWSVDTDDYEQLGSDSIVSKALEGAEPGAVILMHDAGGDRSETVEALPGIIEGLRRRDLRPVTIPRLILDDPPLRGQVLPDISHAS